MNRIKLGGGLLEASEIALGCWRDAQLGDVKKVDELIMEAVGLGIDFFDHADIYEDGASEQVFGEVLAMHPGLRDQISIQTKCGIRDHFFDFSTKHILQAVDGSLKRLGTDYIDVLLLHRPDVLVDPEEVALAFDQLHAAGKVRHFGVSNQTPMYMELLAKYLHQQLIANQLQFSVTNTGMIDFQLNMNTATPAAINRNGEVLEYCRLKDITVQAWSPFQYGEMEGIFIGSDRYPALNRKLEEIGERYGVSASAIAISWILRHPGKIQPIVGTTKPARLRDICTASGVKLTKQEWYEIYRSAGNLVP